MKTCKDCYHYETCHRKDREIPANTCRTFKDKSLVLDLPCKVGDTVYRIVMCYKGEMKIVEGEVFEFAITHEYCTQIKYRFYFMAKGESYIKRNYSLWRDFDDFGETVFLTREAAEQALKEREQGCQKMNG